MKKILFLIFIFTLAFNSVFSQELNCKVTVISPTVQMSNKQIFNSMQQSVWQFMNTRKWTSNQYEAIEKIECNLQIEITSMNADIFTAKLQINSLRPVFGSNYKSILFNHLDADCGFNYVEFQQMEFQENANISNLTSLLAFYAYYIIGIDYDTYALEGGTTHFTKAQAIANLNVNQPGWEPNAGSSSSRNRYYLIENAINSRYKPIREAYYQYHRFGLDEMYKDVDKGREAITLSIKLLEPVFAVMPNAMFLKVFFNAKYSELAEIYKKAPVTDRNKMVELLKRLDPGNATSYEKIKDT